LFCSALATHRPALAGKAEWKEFTSKEGGFAVLLPGTPVEQRQLVKTPVGSVDVHLFVVDPEGAPGAYVVGYSDFPEVALNDGGAQKRLDNARDGAVAQVKGKLKSEKKIKLKGVPGRELHIEVNDKTAVRLRLYVVQNRLYQVMSIGPREATA